MHHAICQIQPTLPPNRAPSSPRLLVLDDDADLRALLARYLSAQGFFVRTLASAQQLYQLLAQERFDALVLDIMMPDEDGLAVCSHLRAQGETLPILMLTAHVDKVNRTVGLETGADDYMTKPFEPRELLARINAQLGKHHAQQPNALPESSIAVGTWAFNPVKGKLTRGPGEVLDLSPTERTLLQALVTQPLEPLGREHLIALAHAHGINLTDHTIDLQIMRLRRLIELDAAHPHLIQTVWGEGYMFVPSTPR